MVSLSIERPSWLEAAELVTCPLLLIPSAVGGPCALAYVFRGVNCSSSPAAPVSDQEGEDKYLNSSQRCPEEAPVLTDQRTSPPQKTPGSARWIIPMVISLRASLAPSGHVWW